MQYLVQERSRYSPSSRSSLWSNSGPCSKSDLCGRTLDTDSNVAYGTTFAVDRILAAGQTFAAGPAFGAGPSLAAGLTFAADPSRQAIQNTVERIMDRIKAICEEASQRGLDRRWIHVDAVVNYAWPREHLDKDLFCRHRYLQVATSADRAKLRNRGTALRIEEPLIFARGRWRSNRSWTPFP